MASGRKAVTHAIPALQPIVHDLFVLRGTNKADAGKELETQKEVVVSMLLRLIQYHQVLEMFILVLQQCHKENEDKWKRLSRQIADVILPMLAKQQMHIDSHEALGVLNTLFEILAPSSLRPVDMLLRSMFVTPDTMVSVLPHDGTFCSCLCSAVVHQSYLGTVRVMVGPGNLHFIQVPRWY